MYLTFRAPTPADLPAITEIYNHAVLYTTFALDTEPKTPSAFEAFIPTTTATDTPQIHDRDPAKPRLHRMIVVTANAPTITPDSAATMPTIRLVGYAGTYPFSARAAYAQLAEMMLYVHPDYQGQGIGRELLQRVHHGSLGVLDGLYTTLALVNAENGAALRLFRELGYVDRGTMVDVAVKFGRRHSLVVLQLSHVSDGGGEERDGSAGLVEGDGQR